MPGVVGREDHHGIIAVSLHSGKGVPGHRPGVDVPGMRRDQPNHQSLRERAAACIADIAGDFFFK